MEHKLINGRGRGTEWEAERQECSKVIGALIKMLQDLEKKNLSSYGWLESLELRKLSLKNVLHVFNGIKCARTNCLLLMACTTSEASVCHSLISSSLFPKKTKLETKKKRCKIRKIEREIGRVLRIGIGIGIGEICSNVKNYKKGNYRQILNFSRIKKVARKW